MEALVSPEGAFLLFLEARRTPLLDALMVFITRLGDGGVIWILLALLLLIRRKTRTAGVMMAAALILDALLVNLCLKNLFMRPRPFEALELSILILPPADWSFPSGHAAASAAAAFTALRQLPLKAGVPAAVLAGLICFSRMYIGVHYPTDVLGGVIVGVLCGWLAEKAVRKLPEKVKRKLRMEE